jgi:hypothetical protein
MGLGAWLQEWFFKGFGTYNLMYLLNFIASRIGALLAMMLRLPRRTLALPVVSMLAGS